MEKDQIRWEKSEDKLEADRAVQTHAVHCAKGHARSRSASTMTDALQNLHKKYGFGDGSKIIDERDAHVGVKSDVAVKDDASSKDAVPSNVTDTAPAEPATMPTKQEAQNTQATIAEVEITEASEVHKQDAATHDEADAAECTHMNVWDNGGQPMFQVIQHLYMPRLGVYALLFNLKCIFEESQRKEALRYLTFWLRSIDTHASHRSAEEQYREVQFQYPPLVLIGTHLDQIKEDLDAALRSIHEILLAEFGGKIKSFQSDSDTCIPGREFLYNGEQGLCFFPVDNSDVNDKNARKLRTLLADAVKEDPLDYINDLTPIVWLKVFDKLLEAREDEPVMKIYSSDDEISVIKLMRNVGALHDCGDDLSKCKARAQAMLQFFDLRGAVVCPSQLSCLTGQAS